MRRFVVASLLATVSLTLPAAGSDVPPACPPATASDRLDAVTQEGEPVLRSGAIVRLAGVRLPDAPPAREAALAWLRDTRGREVLVHAGSERDRWGRLPARLVLLEGTGRLDVAHGLVEAGLAVVEPATGEGACVLETLALEATARERGLGLWVGDRYKPVRVEDVTGLQERIGQFTLVEGRVRSIGERRQQTFLNFGTDWASDFTIIVPKRVWSLLQQRSLGRSALQGHRIRARGVLEQRQGPALTITAPEAVEALSEPGGRH
jgi:endonuclease YncB( thermonuclease family)